MTKEQQQKVDSGYRLAEKGHPKPFIDIWMTAGWHDYHIIHRTGVY